MKPGVIFIFCAALSIFAMPAHAAQRNLAVTSSAGEQKRVALVIGNAAYQGASALRNPVNDAKAMSDALNRLGFQVIEVTDATQKEMNRAITTFGKKLNTETAALFFYAGHGLQVKGKNYIIPVDAQIEAEAAVASEAVSVDAVLEQLNVSSVSIVILDACRNNPFERSFRKMGGGGLAQMDAPKGSFIAYATAPGKTAADGDGKNGLFTQELLKHINEPGVELGMMMRRVRSSVAAKSGDAQMPWDSSSMTGEFYFKPGDATQVASLVPVPVQPARVKSKEEIEDGAWNTAESLNTIEAINTYLSGYPKGRYVAQARMKLAALKAEANKPVPPPTPASAYRPSAANTAGLSIACTGDDVDAGIWINGALKGECPVELKLPEGEIDLKVLKPVDAEHERLYERKLHLTADSVKKIDVKLTLQLTAEGKRQAAIKEEADAARLKTALEEIASNMVKIPGRNYEMGKYEVTQKEWRDVMGSNPSHFKSCGDNCPVEQVSWNDVQEYIQKLNQKAGRQYRLPDEAEWEYACYGGSQTEYCGGGNIDAVAWYGNNGQPGGDSNQTTHPVGQKQANGYGLYDMSGNVWEWMENWYASSKTAYGGNGRALRGGSWSFEPRYVRAAYRNYDDPALRSSYGGFRLARTL